MIYSLNVFVYSNALINAAVCVRKKKLLIKVTHFSLQTRTLFLKEIENGIV